MIKKYIKYTKSIIKKELSELIENITIEEIKKYCKDQGYNYDKEDYSFEDDILEEFISNIYASILDTFHQELEVFNMMPDDFPIEEIKNMENKYCERCNNFQDFLMKVGNSKRMYCIECYINYTKEIENTLSEANQEIETLKKCKNKIITLENINRTKHNSIEKYSQEIIDLKKQIRNLTQLNKELKKSLNNTQKMVFITKLKISGYEKYVIAKIPKLCVYCNGKLKITDDNWAIQCIDCKRYYGMMFWDEKRERLHKES